MTQAVKIPGQGRVYKRGTKWYIDYWAGGRRVRESAGGNMGGAMKLLAKRSEDPSAAPAKKLVPFSAFADTYLELKGSGPKPRRSIRSIRGYINHLKAFFGDRPLARITAEMVEAYRDKRSEDAARPSDPERKMKGASINRELATLRNIFSTARKKSLFGGSNPVSDVAFFPEHRRDHKILDAGELKRLLDAADQRLRPIIQVAFLTGLRKSDVLGLKRRDVHFDRGFLTAWVSKTQEWKSFAMGEELAAILKAVPGKGEFIFMNPETETRWNDIKKWWMAAKKTAGLDAPGLLRFHDLRANCGTRVNERAGLYAAQTILGHKSQKTTQNYLQVPPERAQVAAQVLADFLKVASETPGTNVAQAPSQAVPSSAESTH